MTDERELIARVEAADPAEFADILQRASAEEGRILRLYFGDEQFRTMRALAVFLAIPSWGVAPGSF